MQYLSKNNSFIKEIKKLNEKKYRDTVGKFIVEGEHLVNEAIQAGVVDFIITADNDYKNEITTHYVTPEILKYISSLDTPQKIMAVCHKIDNKKISNRVLILDGIQDPGNLGTIIRSCVAFNIDTLLLSKDTVDLYNSKVIRASQGMIFKLNIMCCDIENIISDLKGDNYLIIGTDVVNGNKIRDFKNCEKFAIIMGNEGRGLSPECKKLCDKFIYIPMNKNCESLNVGVATSIILYELGD